MTDLQRPRFDGTITLGNVLTLVTLVLAVGVAYADLRSGLTNEREHRLALERRIEREQSEQDRRLEQAITEVKALLGGVRDRLDRVLETRRVEGPR